MGMKHGVVLSLAFVAWCVCAAAGGAKCKLKLPPNYANARPPSDDGVTTAPTHISVAMVVNDLVKVDDEELSYTIDIAYVSSPKGACTKDVRRERGGALPKF